jgi:hypothetical protein
LLAGEKKIFCIPLCAELHEGVEALRRFQKKADPLVDGQPKVSITSLMAAMAAKLAPTLGRRCLLVLDAYFAVGPVFSILKTVRDAAGRRLVHVVTRAKNGKKKGKLGGFPFTEFELARKSAATSLWLMVSRKKVSCFLLISLMVDGDGPGHNQFMLGQCGTGGGRCDAILFDLVQKLNDLLYRLRRIA